VVIHAFSRRRIAAGQPTKVALPAKVKEITAQNLAAGYILKPEADATIAEAKKITIGR
jgi:hypothetical protein